MHQTLGGSQGLRQAHTAAVGILAYTRTDVGNSLHRRHELAGRNLLGYGALHVGGQVAGGNDLIDVGRCRKVVLAGLPVTQTVHATLPGCIQQAIAIVTR